MKGYQQDTCEIKEFLNRAYRMREFIAIREEQLAQLRAATERITPQSYERFNFSPHDNMRERTLCKIIDMEAEITFDIGKMIDSMKQIRAAIAGVEDINYRLLLEMRYLNFKTWEDIADEMNYSERHVYRIHEEAVKQVKISGRKVGVRYINRQK